MSAELVKAFKQYMVSVSIDRVRMSAVPDELKPLLTVYREALNSQLSDPENESWSSLGPNERYNALQAVCIAFSPAKSAPRGNCPRCSGHGVILAYSHVLGGRCLKCEGTGNIKVGPANE